MFARLKRALNVTRIAITSPTPQPGRDGVALVAILRNEARHIEEWAQFHPRAGIGHFFNYNNGSTDGTPEVLRETIPVAALPLILGLRSFTSVHVTPRSTTRSSPTPMRRATSAGPIAG